MARYNRLRKFLPTAGRLFGLSDLDALAVGNWVEVPQGGGSDGSGRARHLAVRYTGSKLERSRIVKQWLVDTLLRVMRQAWKEQPELAPDTDNLMLKPDSLSWIDIARVYNTMTVPPLSSPNAAESSTAKESSKKRKRGPPSSSSSTSSSDESEVQGWQGPTDVDLDLVLWFRQGKKLHLQGSLSAEVRPVAWCRDVPFAQDPSDRGIGIEGVTYEETCRKCLARCPADMNAAITEFFGIME